MTPTLPSNPARENDGWDCTLVEDDRDDLPDHIQPCECDEHHGVCDTCGFKITVASSGTEYGHARATNRDPALGADRTDCRHRPSECDPNGPQAQDYRGRGQGGKSA